MRLKLTIAYDGAPFTGWQSQAHKGAVQDFLEAAVQKVSGKRVTVHGAGRTDAGVHALAQCAHFDAPSSNMKPEDWRNALNANLPPGIRVMKCRRAPEDFHARFSATGKIYRYLVHLTPILPPHELGRVWHIPQEINLAALKEAAAFFVGWHDFTAFTANRGGPPPDPHRTIQRVSVARKGDLLSLTFEGEGFLYKMVRMLTAALMRVAQERHDAGDLYARLRDGGPRWNRVAPPEGLYLVKVLYGRKEPGKNQSVISPED
jgi:tRNA pseudouridine38-40 synthase